MNDNKRFLYLRDITIDKSTYFMCKPIEDDNDNVIIIDPKSIIKYDEIKTF